MGKIRIIGGQWRSRKLEFPDLAGLRPTQDRIRETLFNWLSRDILDSVCLDLFSGSGALGFEALSRGAKKVFFLDSDREALASLKINAEKLQAQGAEILFSDFPKNLPKFSEKFNIVFLDPPFDQDLILPALNWLVENNLLNDGAKIYLEMKKREKELLFPPNFEVLKNESTASLEYFLLRKI